MQWPRTSIRAACCTVALLLAACADDFRDIGQYRVVRATDRFFGLSCQPRQDYYFRQNPGKDDDLLYLGSCGSPQFVIEHLHLPSDPSCFAVSETGSDMVFLHRPELCGIPASGGTKAAGLYRHTAESGETMLYSRAQVGQVWSSAPLAPYSVRVAWHSNEPSNGGARCSQRLIVHVSGNETPEGEPNTIHGCKPHRSTAP